MIRFFIFILCVSFTNFVSAEENKLSGAFRVYPVDNERISSVLNDSGRNDYAPSSSNMYKTGFEIILPDGITKKGYLTLRSAKTHKMVYRGSYTDKQTIIFDADYQLLDDKGLDFLKIVYYDIENKISYVCEQQKPFQLWEAGSISTITILSERKPDEEVEGDNYCYEAKIYKKIDNPT